MPKISAIIITMNEEHFIDKCLQSLDDIADEVIVVDSFSTDATKEICRKHNVKFYEHAFSGYMDQKNYAMTLASNKHILSLDADEALSDELQQSILKVKDNMRYDGYLFNRLNNYRGNWIRHSAWYPDRQLRLFNSEKGCWGKINVHETFIMNHDSRIGRLEGDLLHWPYTSERDLKEKYILYSEIGAREYLRTGIKAYFFTPAIHMIWRFFLTYILHLGFLHRDGYVICSTGAYSSYLKYSKLRELQRETRRKS